MAVTTVTTTDLAKAMAESLTATLTGVRVYAYVADNFRPPGVVIAQPDIDFGDVSSGFCAAVWRFPITVIATRHNDRDAQADLAALVMDVANALDDAFIPAARTVEVLDARPRDVSVGGGDLPAYQLTVQVKA